MYKVICVVGARPNFMKIAPIMRQINETSNIEAILVHTGQHYDAEMKQSFFAQLNIQEPDVDLGVGSGSHAVQTAEVMKRFEPVLDKVKPDAVLVVGDVNSTIACSLVAAKKGIAVIHVEAGLRSNDWKMPEEINRVLTDRLSDILFTTEKSALQNLLAEGIDKNKVHFVGNVMIDTLYHQIKKAEYVSSKMSDKLEGLNPDKDEFALLTLHRPSNVDDKEVLSRLMKAMQIVSKTMPIVFPLHPRTKKRLDEFSLNYLLATPDILVTEPLGYHQMIKLMSKARVVLTDSGGIQEETTALGIPCITLRENTERPITVSDGTNTIAGSDSDKILDTFFDIVKTGGKRGKVPEKWDGQAANRIVTIIVDWFDTNRKSLH